MTNTYKGGRNGEAGSSTGIFQNEEKKKHNATSGCGMMAQRGMNKAGRREGQGKRHGMGTINGDLWMCSAICRKMWKKSGFCGMIKML